MTGPPVAIDAGARLRRLLAVLAYLARVGEAPLADLAERFQLDEKTLVAELELAACCGLPPYTPDQLLELVVDDECVRAFGLDALRRPPRLTADEGFALAASVRALLAVPGVDEVPLASALEKLEVVLGHDRVSVELDVPERLVELRRHAARGEVIEIEYLGAQPGSSTTRVVEPHSVVAREGRYYLDAYCRLAGGWRRFGVDRVVAVRPTGEACPPREVPVELAGERAFAGGGELPRVTVVVDAGQDLLVRRVAVGPPATEADGRLAYTVEVANEYFLGRLLLRLGPTAELRAPGELGRAPAVVARRALERYRSRR